MPPEYPATQSIGLMRPGCSRMVQDIKDIIKVNQVRMKSKGDMWGAGCVCVSNYTTYHNLSRG